MSEIKIEDDSHVHFRKLWEPPVLLVDWQKLNIERKTSWGELFYDLIFVAASTSVSDIFFDKLDFDGFYHFLVYWITFLTLWNKMNMYQTRFSADSLFHQAIVFIHMFGLLLMLHHTSSELNYFKSFSIGILISLITFLILYLLVAIYIKRARVMAIRHLFSNSISCIFVGMTFILSNSYYITILWLTIPIIDFFNSLISIFTMKKSDSLPINLSHISGNIILFRNNIIF